MRRLLLVALAALACSGGKKSNAHRVDAMPKKAVDPGAAGVIRGAVAHAGPPQTRDVTITEAACKGGPATEPTVTVQDGKLANAFVWVKHGLEPWAFPAATGEVVIDQKQCMYTPHVVGVRVGQPLVFSTSDPVTHNVHTLAEANDPANFAMDHPGQKISRTFETTEVMIQTKCDIHPWMKAWIGVVDHPFFAVTGADGAFEFKGLPAGTYEVEVWHETLGVKTAQVTLAEQGTQEVKFDL